MTDLSRKRPKARDWLLAIRPKTLPAAVAPIAVGTAAAWQKGGFVLWPAMAALLGALLLQIGVNLANDYFDYRAGVDTADRVGPVRVTQAGIIVPETVRSMLVAVMVISMLVGIALIIRGGWAILAAGVASLGAVLAYSGGPRPLASLGLGDLSVFLFFGPVAVCGADYVQSLAFSGTVVLYSIPVGLLITNILIVNNLRDMQTDRAAGKKTLAVRIGAGASRLEYLFLNVVSYLVPSLMVLSGRTSPWVLLVLVSMPLSVDQVKKLYRFTGRDLNLVLAQTARLALVFSLLLSAGIVIGS